jgi:chromosome segregation ATPase
LTIFAVIDTIEVRNFISLLVNQMLNINNTNTANLTLEQQRDTMTDAQLREEIGNFRLKGDTVNVKKLSDYIQNRTEEQSKKVEEAEITFKQQFERDILGKIDEKGNFIHQATDDAGKKAEYDSWVQAFMRDISKYRNLTGNQDQKLEAQNKKVGDLIAELNDEKTTTTTLEKKVDEAWLNPPSVIDLVY